MLQPIGLASSSGQSRSEWTPVTSWSLWSTSCIETQPSATSSPPFLPPPSGLAYSVKHARAARGRWQTGRSVCSHSFH